MHLLIEVITALHADPVVGGREGRKNGPLLLEQFVLQVTEHNGDLY